MPSLAPLTVLTRSIFLGVSGGVYRSLGHHKKMKTQKKKHTHTIFRREDSKSLRILCVVFARGVSFLLVVLVIGVFGFGCLQAFCFKTARSHANALALSAKAEPNRMAQRHYTDIVSTVATNPAPQQQTLYKTNQLTQGRSGGDRTDPHNSSAIAAIAHTQGVKKVKMSKMLVSLQQQHKCYSIKPINSRSEKPLIMLI